MTLRLVGSEPPKERRRRGERRPVLSREDEQRFRQAMRNLRDAFGTWGALAAAMGANVGAIKLMMRRDSGVSGAMIVRAMRASGLSYDALMGTPVLAGTCRACGRVRAA